MKSIVFCGYGPLAYVVLNELIKNNYIVNYVLTHKDLQCGSVDGLCEKNNIKFTYRIPNKHKEHLTILFKSYAESTLISVNYRFIIPKEIFSFFRYSFNVHGSLLPKYRGRTPHIWALINGEKECGVTSHIVEEKVDTGAIIIQKKVSIEPEDNGFDLLEKYKLIYPEIVLESLNVLDTDMPLTVQDENKADYLGERTPIMGSLYAAMSCKEAGNMIRALHPPYPGAYFYNSQGDKVIAFRSIKEDSQLQSNNCFAEKMHNNYWLKFSDGYLCVFDFEELKDE